jgi:hypothetical protein
VQVDKLTGPRTDAPDKTAVSSIVADADAHATAVEASISTLNTAIRISGGATTTTG